MPRSLSNIIPAAAGVSITPDDDNDLPNPGLLLSCTGSGNAKVDDMNGTTLTIYLTQGAVFPLQVRRVHATDTAATGIIGLYIE
jgi:hypothetical protein